MSSRDAARLACLVGVLVSACGYTLAGSQPRVPGGVRSVAVGEFRNESNEKGLQLLSILLEIDPENANIRENRGLIYVRQQKFQEAVDDLEKVVVKNPDKRTVHQALSLAYGKLGKKDLADKHGEIAQALQRNPRAMQKKDPEATQAPAEPAAP